MDPFGHHPHQGHHHRRDDYDRDEDYPPPPQQQPPPYGDYSPPPPQPSYYSGEDYPPQPPPPQSTHVYHSSHHPGGGPEYPPPSRVPDYYDPRRSEQQPPPPQVTHVQHVSHNSSSYGNEEPHHHRPHVPSIISHHIHHQEGGSDLGGKPSVRVFSKADTNYSLTIRDGKVILVRSDPSDPCQHWIKDEKFSIRVKDEQGFPSFALVNKATGQAIKHSLGATHPVQLIPYNPDVLDESVMWTESKDLGDGYRTIRMVNNIRLNFDAFDGNKDRGGVHDGTTIVLWEWGKKENQRWRIVPY